MADELNEEEKAQALYHARQGVLALIERNPALGIRVAADDLVEVYLAGIIAGVEAASGVFDAVARRMLEDEPEGPEL